MAKGVAYEFTPKEFFYLMFKKKVCPKCGGKMTKNKRCEIVNGSQFKHEVDDLNLSLYDVKHYFYTFTCEDCGAEFELSQLLKTKES